MYQQAGWQWYTCGIIKIIPDFPLEEILMKGKDLYAKIGSADGGFTGRLYPIGKKTFGRKGGFVKIAFGENCLTVDRITCKKL